VEYKTGGEARGLTWSKAGTLGWMYVQFIVVYALVMVLTYFGRAEHAVYRLSSSSSMARPTW